jgi:molecular chaperone DnaK
VTAKDNATNKEQKITIQGGTGLSKDEIENMVKDAESHASEDKKRKEEVEIRNTADSLCYTAEKALKDAGDKISDELKQEIEGKVTELKNVLQTASTNELKTKTQELSASLQKIGQYMYDQPGTQPPPQDQGTSGAADSTNTAEDSPEGQDNEENSEPVEGEVIND